MGIGKREWLFSSNEDLIVLLLCEITKLNADDDAAILMEAVNCNLFVIFSLGFRTVKLNVRTV